MLDFGLGRSGLDRLSHGDQPVSITGEFLKLAVVEPGAGGGVIHQKLTRDGRIAGRHSLSDAQRGVTLPYEVVGNIRDIEQNDPTAASCRRAAIADSAKAKNGAGQGLASAAQAGRGQ